MSFRRGPSNLEIAMMIGNLNPNSTTRPCTQCQREVPKTQVLLTCDKCRESKKRQKQRKKERDMAIAEGRGKGPNEGFSSAALQAVVAKQEQETAAKRAARRKAGSTSTAKAESSSASGLGSGLLGIVLQAILNEHEISSKPAPKKKTKKQAPQDEESLEETTSRLLFEMATAEWKSSSGTKRKIQEVEPNEPGSIYDAETAKKRLRGDMPMPKLEPIGQTGKPAAESSKKAVAKPAASSTQSSKPLPLSRKASNLPPPTESDSGAKPQKVQANLSGWFKPAPKSTA